MSCGDEVVIRRVDQGGEPPAEVRAEAAVYNPLVLALYDGMVVHLANQYAWRCPMPVLLEWYRSNVSSNNRLGVIDNVRDSLADLESALGSRFSRVEVRVVGSVALFSGRIA